MNRKLIYLTSTAILAMESTAGAYMDLAKVPYAVQDIHSIGYPTYILYILGAWKVLAVGALLWPGFPRLREWAYAGLFFEMFGAVESHFLAGDPLGKYVVPLVFTVITFVSWGSQPDRPWSRIRQAEE